MEKHSNSSVSRPEIENRIVQLTEKLRKDRIKGQDEFSRDMIEEIIIAWDNLEEFYMNNDDDQMSLAVLDAYLTFLNILEWERKKDESIESDKEWELKDIRNEIDARLNDIVGAYINRRDDI
jgi:signal transduction protein with GAF and PtsI domain